MNCHRCGESLPRHYTSRAFRFPDGAPAFCSDACLKAHIFSQRPHGRKAFESAGIFSAPDNWKSRECYSLRLGVTFRSWAECSVAEHVVFSWRTPVFYEPHTLRVDAKHLYVPDFWLPRFGVWLEVKGEWRMGAMTKFSRAQRILGPDRLLLVPSCYRWLFRKGGSRGCS